MLLFYNHLIVYMQIFCHEELKAASMDGNVKSPLIVKRRLPIVSIGRYVLAAIHH